MVACGLEFFSKLTNYSMNISERKLKALAYARSCKKQDTVSGNCKFCGKECKNQNSLRNHERCCKHNPERFIPKHETWNKGKKVGCLQKKQVFACEFCGKTWETTKSNYTNHIKYRCEKNPNRKIVFHGPTEEGKKKLSKLAKSRGLGGFVPDSKGGKEKRGYYKGLYCMSSWELAFVVYNLDKGEAVEQCKEHFDYEMNGEKHSYTPDFKIGNIYYEIKGWHRPDTDFKVDAFPKNKTLVLLDGRAQNEIYIKYAKEKYGTKFWEVLYEK